MKYILFDLDGTLTESGIGIKRCVQYALEHFNINENNDDKLRLFIGPPLFDSFTKKYGLTEEQANKAIELYRVRYSPKISVLILHYPIQFPSLQLVAKAIFKATLLQLRVS